MRVRRALGAVMAVLGAAAMGACYSVPDVVEAGAAPQGDGGVEEHEAEAGGGPGVDASEEDSAGGGDAHVDAGTDAATCGGLLSSCMNNLDCCAKTFCSAGAVASGVIQQAGGHPFCTKPCCSSADCPAGTVCFASGEGGQYCVDPAWIGRSTPSATAKSGGTTCSTGADCRSGLCTNGTCQDTCCSQKTLGQDECAPPAACVFGAFPGSSSLDTHFAPHCGVVSGSTLQDQPCGADSDCQSGYCGIDYSGMKACQAPCRNTTDCATGGDICDYGQHGSDLVASCLPGAGGTKQEGESCDQASMVPECVAECGPMSQCTSVCFADNDCTYPGWACEPQSVQFGVGSTAPSYDILICGTP